MVILDYRIVFFGYKSLYIDRKLVLAEIARSDSSPQSFAFPVAPLGRDHPRCFDSDLSCLSADVVALEFDPDMWFGYTAIVNMVELHTSTLERTFGLAEGCKSGSTAVPVE